MINRLAIAGLFLCSSLVFGQVTPTAVTDGASFSGRVAPGGLATIFGSNLAVAVQYASVIPLPTFLGGTEVSVDGVPAPLIYVNPGQINFQVPASIQPGLANVVVTVNGQSSQPIQAAVNPTAPGIFAYNPLGGAGDPTLLQAVIQNPPDYNNSNINSPSNPAPAGSVVVAYIGGIGDVQHPVSDGYPAVGVDSAVAPSFAMIGGEQAAISYLGLSPGSVGLGQANIKIPSDLPSGDYPLLINIGGLQSISTVISVSGSGTLPLYLQEVSLFNNFEVSNRTTVIPFNKALYLCGDVRVRVFDITNPAAPVFDGEYGDSVLNQRQISCNVNDTVSLPYLASVVGPPNNPTFTVFDISQNQYVPATLTAGAGMDSYTDAKRVVFDGNTGLVNTSWVDGSNSKHGDIVAFDFTNPAQPVYLSTLPVNTNQLKTFIRMQPGHTLYATTGTAGGGTVGGNGALDVIDTSDPTNLRMTNQVVASGTSILQAFAVSGNTLLALGNTTDVTPGDYPVLTYQGNLTLTTMDVSNVLDPVFITTVDTGIQADGALRVVNLGNNSGIFAVVYGSSYTDPFGPTTLAIVDASNPAQPFLYPQSTYYYYDGLASASGYLFAANQNGMNIYQVSLP